jgi:hypothetical protein
MRTLKEVTSLEHEIRERYARAAWTHKVHEKDADKYHGYHVKLTWLKIVLSALAAALSGTGVLLGEGGSSCPAIIGSLLFLVNLIFENRNFETLSNAHRNAAASILQIREDWLSLISDLHREDCDLGKIAARRDRISRTWCEVLKSTPRTSSSAYTEATQALHGDELTFEDEEIDHLLPPAFRIVEDK